MQKQEWFERYEIRHGLPEVILDNLREEPTNLNIDDWQCWKFACLRMAVDMLPPKEKKVIHHYYFMQEHPNIIAKKLRLSVRRFYEIRDIAIKELERQALINFFLKT